MPVTAIRPKSTGIKTIKPRVTRSVPRQKPEHKRLAYKDTFLFHHSIRIGRGGRPVRLTKFRTMKRGAQLKRAGHITGGTGQLDKLTSNDRRVTWIGKFLRRTHLDESPQIADIVNGKLQLVGMRPLIREEYRKLPPKIRRIYDIMKPGLAGIQYACRPFPPTTQQLYAEFRRFYEIWKVSPAKAYYIYGKKIAANKLLGRARTR